MGITDFVNARLGFEISSNDELPFSVSTMAIERGTVITEYQQVEKNAYFLVDGLMQAESVTADMLPKILDFIFPGNFVCGYVSFISQEPSQVCLSALTDCKLQVIDREEVYELYKTSLMMNQLGRKIAEHQVVQKTHREIMLLTKPAKERYLDLLHSHPEYIHTIPVNKIAQHLGIQPESLSRIRKELIS